MFYGLCVCLLLGLVPGNAGAGCDLDPRKMRGAAWQQAAVRRVLDGDTLELDSGERVRMVGINAPETAKYGKPGDPLGQGARARLQALATPGDILFFHRDRTPQDRYGRLLLHPYLTDGRNLTAQLLQEGWGFHVVIPPNAWEADCYRHAEQRAMDRRLGVWGLAHYEPVSATNMARLKGGYQRVTGRVERFVLTRFTGWIDLAGHVSIKVAKDSLGTVDGKVWQQLLEAAQQGAMGQLPTLEVRGWMSDRRDWGENMRRQIQNGTRKPFQFNVRHRYDWRLLDAIHSD